MMNVWDTDGLHVELYDAEREPNLAIGREHAVLVGGATGRSMADRLATMGIASQKDLVASLKSVGLRLSGPLPPEPKFMNGVRLHSLATKSGSTDVRVDVLDYAEAAQKKGGSTVRFEGRKVLILSGSSPIVGTPEEVGAEIMGN